MSSADETSNSSPSRESLKDEGGKEEEAFDPLSKGDDLSDVSDLESHDGLQEVAASSPHKSMQEQLGETELDFEAEEKDADEQQKNADDDEGEAKSDGELKDGDNDLEEGECTDGEDARPEEESKPVCRFYNRGQCTWGANCRFVHPGVTDKGNYTMFDMVRPLVPTNGPPGAGDPYFEKQFGSHGAAAVEGPPAESAWERGLRHAKEMMKKATRRKETDMDFEEKKMNLGLGQEDLDKENDFYTRPASPIHRFEDNADRRYSRDADYYPHEGMGRSHESSSRGQAENYYKQRQHRDLRESIRGRSRDHSSFSPEASHSRSQQASKHLDREESERGRGPQKSRADDWSDPWMRHKSPTRKGTSWKRSHSSDSSGSSSSGSSDSDSSSSSDSRYSGGNYRSSKKGKYEGQPSRAPKYDKPAAPKAKEAPAPKRRPPPEEFPKSSRMAKEKPRRRTISKSSVNSNSSFTSSSGDEQPSSRVDRSSDFNMTKTKAMDAMKLSGQKQQIKLNLRDLDAPPKSDGGSKKKNAPAAVSDAKGGGKKSVTRREELLKQLKAVEDAIRRKKSKPA